MHLLFMTFIFLGTLLVTFMVIGAIISDVKIRREEDLVAIAEASDVLKK